MKKILSNKILNWILTLKKVILIVTLILLASIYSNKVNAVKDNQPLILVVDGKPQATIVISSVKSKTLEFAVQELNFHIWQITGVKLPVVDDQQKVKGTRILVGRSLATDNLGIDLSNLKDQEYVVKTMPGVLILAGKDDPEKDSKSRLAIHLWNIDRIRLPMNEGDNERLEKLPNPYHNIGTLYAVYDFLEQNLGIRWYSPGDLGTIINKQDNITINHRDTRRTPSMEYREPFLGDFGLRRDRTPQYTTYEKALWMLRIRAGGKDVVQGNHSFLGYYDRFSKEHGKNPTLFESDHPEFFAKGLTKEQMNAGAIPGGMPNLCYSNQGLVDQVVKDIRDYFNGKGSRAGMRTIGDYVSLGPMDMAPYCKCEACEKMYVKPLDAIDRSSRSNYWFQFVNRVAREVRKTHPDKTLSVLAYYDFAGVPAGLKLEPNLTITYCFLSPSMCWDPARRERDVRAFDRGWAVYPDKNFTLYAWIYYLGGMMGQMEGEYPDACAFKVPAFMRKLHESGVKGVFIQEAEGSGYSYLFSQLELYLTLKLADDPSLNGDEMIDEYFYQYYGQGAAAMKQLYQEMENVKYDINNYPAEIRRGDQYNMLSESVVYKNLITPERAARWNKLLGKALSGTKDEYHARVLEYKVGVWDRMVQARKKYLTTTSK